MRRFEFVEGTSAKCWQAESSGTTFIVEFGRLGTKGQRKEKDFPNEDAAKKELDRFDGEQEEADENLPRENFNRLRKSWKSKVG